MIYKKTRYIGQYLMAKSYTKRWEKVRVIFFRFLSALVEKELWFLSFTLGKTNSSFFACLGRMRSEGQEDWKRSERNLVSKAPKCLKS
jgi:hypothetical protein